LVRIYTLMSDLRVPLEDKLWAMFSIVKITKTSSVLNKGVVMTWCHSSFAFQPLKATWWTLQNPQVQGMTWNIFYTSIISFEVILHSYIYLCSRMSKEHVWGSLLVVLNSEI
jgi:hypothetical protein